MVISGLSRGFSTCCLRFKNGVATIHARLASGWLARLYREGVNPLDCDEGFQLTSSSSSLLDFSWRNVRKPKPEIAALSEVPDLG
jgi:hypothetical protein